MWVVRNENGRLICYGESRKKVVAERRFYERETGRCTTMSVELLPFPEIV